MKTGIIGLPQVGKTSLFVMLTRQQVAQRAHGNPREAIARYQRVLLDKLLDNQSQIQAQIYQKMGLAYQELGDPAKAQECFDRAVTLRLKP